MGGRVRPRVCVLANWISTTANGVTQSRQSDPANEITSLDGTTQDVGYEADGNMTVMPKDPLPGYRPEHYILRYDPTSPRRLRRAGAWNRLTGVYEDTGTGTDAKGKWDEGDTLVAAYQYDPPSPTGFGVASALGRRTAKIVHEGTTASSWRRTDLYYDDQWRVVEERKSAQGTYSSLAATAATVVYAQYVYGPGYIDTPIGRFRDANGVPNDGPQGDGLEETLYYTYDANHNITAVLRPDGKVVERYLYDAYEQAHVINGDPSLDPDGAAPPTGQTMAQWTLDPNNKSDVDDVVLATGLRFDPETGNYYARNRIYDPILARFLTADPSPDGRHVDGMNPYQYCLSNPIDATDPMGTETRSWWDFAGSALTASPAAYALDLYNRATGGNVATRFVAKRYENLGHAAGLKLQGEVMSSSLATVVTLAAGPGWERKFGIEPSPPIRSFADLGRQLTGMLAPGVKLDIELAAAVYASSTSHRDRPSKPRPFNESDPLSKSDRPRPVPSALRTRT
jgi:RHS repeat-associated protein